MGVSHVYPTIDFTLIDYAKIPDGACLIGFDTSNEGRLCKIENSGAITIIEDGGLSLNIESGIDNMSDRPPLTAGTAKYGEIRSHSTLYGNLGDDGFLRLSAGAGTNANIKAYIDISGFSIIPDMYSNIVLGTSGVERMRIDAYGNLGIGTTTPLDKLSVAGDISMGFGNSLRARAHTYNKILETGYSNITGQDHTYIYTAGDGVNNTHPKISILRDGFVGVGTLTPTHRLEVYNGSRSNDVSYGLATAWIGGLDVGLTIGNYDTAGWGTWLSSMRYDTTEYPLTLQPLGAAVGIGGNVPYYQLDLSTDGARKLTSTTWLTGSDARVKKNIEPANLQICYDILTNLTLNRFTWDEKYYPEVGDRSSIGFIAQEVKEVFPKAVTFTEEHGFEDFHTLNTDQLYKTLFGAVQHLINKIKTSDSLEDLKNSL